MLICSLSSKNSLAGFINRLAYITETQTAVCVSDSGISEAGKVSSPPKNTQEDEIKLSVTHSCT